jgi:hypothetical protein
MMAQSLTDCMFAVFDQICIGIVGERLDVPGFPPAWRPAGNSHDTLSTII